jgi:hypothetical protein
MIISSPTRSTCDRNRRWSTEGVERQMPLAELANGSEYDERETLDTDGGSLDATRSSDLRSVG